MAKQVTDREKGTDIVASAAEANAERVSKAFGEMFGRFLSKKEKDNLPDMGLLLLLVARALRARGGELVVASDALDRELADDAEPRERRDGARQGLIASMVSIRGTVENVHGLAVLKKLGIDGETPKDDAGILAHVRKFVAELKSPKFKLPKPVRRGVKVDVAEWIDELEGPMKVLEGALKDVTRETREAQVKLEAKTAAMRDNDELFARGARFISAALALVGEDALADKVRPSARRPGTTLEEEPEGAEAEADASGAAAAAEEK